MNIWHNMYTSHMNMIMIYSPGNNAIWVWKLYRQLQYEYYHVDDDTIIRSHNLEHLEAWQPTPCSSFSWHLPRLRPIHQGLPCCTWHRKLFALLDVCVSSLRRGHANILCIVPSLTDDPRRESSQVIRDCYFVTAPHSCALLPLLSSNPSGMLYLHAALEKENRTVETSCYYYYYY